MDNTKDIETFESLVKSGQYSQAESLILTRLESNDANERRIASFNKALLMCLMNRYDDALELCNDITDNDVKCYYTGLINYMTLLSSSVDSQKIEQIISCLKIAQLSKDKGIKEKRYYHALFLLLNCYMILKNLNGESAEYDEEICKYKKSLLNKYRQQIKEDDIPQFVDSDILLIYALLSNDENERKEYLTIFFAVSNKTVYQKFYAVVHYSKIMKCNPDDGDLLQACIDSGVYKSDQYFDTIIRSIGDDSELNEYIKIWYYEHLLMVQIMLAYDNNIQYIYHYTALSGADATLSQSLPIKLNSISAVHNAIEGMILETVINKNKKSFNKKLHSNKQSNEQDSEFITVQTSYSMAKNELLLRQTGNDNGVDYAGVCFEFNKSFFMTDPLNVLNTEATSSLNPLFYVMYYDESDNLLCFSPYNDDSQIIIKIDKKSVYWDNTISCSINDKNLKYVFCKMIKLIKQVSNTQIVSQVLYKLKYLIKTSNNADQKELRMLNTIPYSDAEVENNNMILYQNYLSPYLYNGLNKVILDDKVPHPNTKVEYFTKIMNDKQHKCKTELINENTQEKRLHQKLFKKPSFIRKKRTFLQDYVDGEANTFFEYFVLVVIVINMIFLGIDTFQKPNTWLKHLCDAVDDFCFYVYFIELLIEIIAYKKDFFKYKWNIFDLIIVLLSFFSTKAFLGLKMLKAVKSLKVLKSFRAIKTAKIISSITYLQKILKSLVRSLPGIFWIFILLSVVYYIYALIGTNLFNDPNIIDDITKKPIFGNLWSSLYALFQLMTFDNWDILMHRVTNVHPWAWIYFISFVLITSFILMQVVTGIVVDAVKSVDLNNDESGLNQVHRNIDDLSKQIDILTIEIRRLKNQVYLGEPNTRKKGIFNKLRR